MKDGVNPYEQFFQEADADGSGFLSLDELVAMMKKKAYSGTDKQMRAMFRSVDTSGDNKVSRDEYMVAMGQQESTTHASALVRQAFREFDTDDSGTIERSEMDAAFKEMGRYFTDDELNRMMVLLDKDQSGTVDYEEFIKSAFGTKRD